jgi:hypothetical protein
MPAVSSFQFNEAQRREGVLAVGRKFLHSRPMNFKCLVIAALVAASPLPVFAPRPLPDEMNL